MRKIFLLALLSLAACAPKVEDRVYPDPKRDFKPRLEDIDLKAQFPEIYLFDFDAQVYWNGDTKWGTLYRQIEHLMTIGQALNEPKLIELAKALLEKSRTMTANFSVIDLGHSPFAELAISQTEEETKKALNQADKDIQTGTTKLLSILDKAAKNKKWPKNPMEIDQVGVEVEKFLIQFRDQSAQADIFQPMKDELKKEIDTQIQWAKNVTKELGDVSRSATTLDGFIDPVKAIIEREKFEVDPKLIETMIGGKVLAEDLKKCTNSQAALTVIVDVWVLLDEKEREQYIKPVNKDLYDYLHGKGDKMLTCLKKDNCSGIFKDMLKSVFILPKIEKYGFAKLCKEVNDQSLEFSRKAMREAGPEILVTLPKMVKESLEKAVNEKRADFKMIQADFPKFVKDRVSNWSKAKLKSAPLGFEPDRLQISMAKKEISFEPGHTAQNTTPEGIGAGMSLYKQIWDLEAKNNPEQLDREYLLRTGLEQINRLVALGGYKNSVKATVPAFLAPTESAAPLLDLEKVTEIPFSYAAPDVVAFDKSMKPVAERPTDDSGKNYSARTKAELIRGLSSMIEFFQDWNVTSYDSSLGKIVAQDLVPDFETPDLQRSVFPKEDLLALSIAEAATLLKNITKKNSPVFLVTLENKIQWASDYDFDKGETAVMAGIVDIVKNQRGKTVKADDVSRMIISLAKFLEVTKDIEKTKSELLLKQGDDGKNAVETLVESREQIKLLIVGLTNLLSHQFVTKDASVARSLRLETLNPDETEERSILDQALAIRAMLSAAKATGIDIYRISAIDLYYAMNQKFYNPKMRFYSVSLRTETLPMPVVLETIAALAELKPHLPADSQKQLTWVLKPWIEGFKHLK